MALAAGGRGPGVKQGSLPIRAGLVAGSVAAMVAALVNLPLHSPSDAFLNSATVMVGSLLAGLAAGCLWGFPGLWGVNERLRQVIFGAGMVLALGLVSVVAVVAETQVQRAVSYLVPLGAVVLGMTGVLTWILLRAPRLLMWRLTVVAVAAAIGLGVGLAGQGDQKSGALELPPRASAGMVSDGTFPA